MRVPGHIVEERRKALAALLSEHKYLPISEICDRFSISEATARRDLAALEEEQKIHRTFGGAVSFYSERFPSFRQRIGRNRDAKRALAGVAISLLRPGMVCYLDTGTTAYAVAEVLREEPVQPLTVVTVNLPTAELLVDTDGIAVHLLGGRLIPKQSVLLGPACIEGLKLWKFDLALLSAEGADAEGLWNSQDEIVRLQRGVMQRAASSLFLLDDSKLGRRTNYLLAGWHEPLWLVTNASKHLLLRHGIPTQVIYAASNGKETPR